MGMRSAEGTPLLSVAAAAVALEAVGLCVAVVANAIDDVNGRIGTQSSAVGFMVFEFVIAVGVAAIAWGVARAQPWSRTPAVMVQVFTAMIAIWLLQAHRYAWGLPALLLALVALAGLLAPASLRALNRPREDDPPVTPAPRPSRRS
jgi:hypothetical protein